MASKSPRITGLSSLQTVLPALLRLAIGWHLLYEGFVKLTDPGWSAAGYLASSHGPLAQFFQGLAANEEILAVVNQLNIWGLILIGGSLMFGLVTRFAAVAGILLLALYYVCNPPLIGSAASPIAEGHYLLVNKNLVELLALGVVVVFPSKCFGLDGILGALWARRRARRVKPAAGQKAPPEDVDQITRRQIMAGLVGAPVAGGLALAVLNQHGWHSQEERQLNAQLVGLTDGDAKADALSGATRKFNWESLNDLKGKVPHGKLGKLELSRVLLGGNLIGGWAHARDLIYVSKLVKAYHNREKVFETFRLAEACGINTFLTTTSLGPVVEDYWKHGGGKIQFISDCGGKVLLDGIKKSIDHGASACYVHGGKSDKLAAEGDFDAFAEALELIRDNGLPAGIGGHYLKTVQVCAEHGLKPDFWMKTLHHTDYWSATATREKDNIWCEDPAGTRDFMQEREEPWIAFKTLAAGAIHPDKGFQFAFQGGADFICVGMYDFQVVENANIAVDVLSSKELELERKRPWFS